MSLSFLFGTVGSPDATPPNPGVQSAGSFILRPLALDALELAWVNGVRVGEATCIAINKRAKRTAWLYPSMRRITSI